MIAHLLHLSEAYHIGLVTDTVPATPVLPAEAFRASCKHGLGLIIPQREKLSHKALKLLKKAQL